MIPRLSLQVCGRGKKGAGAHFFLMHYASSSNSSLLEEVKDNSS